MLAHITWLRLSYEAEEFYIEIVGINNSLSNSSKSINWNPLLKLSISMYMYISILSLTWMIITERTNDDSGYDRKLNEYWKSEQFL